MPKTPPKPKPSITISRRAELNPTGFGITPPSSIEVHPEEVRILAFERFLARGQAGGTAEQDWVEAEQELRERRWNGSA